MLLFIKNLSTTFEIHPMQKTVYTYNTAESAPKSLRKGFIEIIKNGETKVVESGTNDEPKTTHFETFNVLENVSATIWGFKQFENENKKIIIFSDLPRTMLNDELHRIINNLSDEKREELF